MSGSKYNLTRSFINRRAYDTEAHGKFAWPD